MCDKPAIDQQHDQQYDWMETRTEKDENRNIFSFLCNICGNNFLSTLDKVHFVRNINGSDIKYARCHDCYKT